MRTLAITQNTTLDGAVEMLDDWFDDQEQAGEGNQDMVEANRRQDEAADALLVGRRTFLDFRGYWRDLADDATGVAEYLSTVRKHVVTSTLAEGDLDWSGSVVVPGGDVVSSVRALKEQPGRDIVCTGSISLCHTLIGAGLVDEYRLYTYPVVQGRGRRLFPDGFRLDRLRRTSCEPFRSGITLSTYRPR